MHTHAQSLLAGMHVVCAHGCTLEHINASVQAHTPHSCIHSIHVHTPYMCTHTHFFFHINFFHIDFLADPARYEIISFQTMAGIMRLKDQRHSGKGLCFTESPGRPRKPP